MARRRCVLAPTSAYADPDCASTPLRQPKVVSTGAAKPNAAIVPPRMQGPTVAVTAQPAPGSPLQQIQIDAVPPAGAHRRALRDQAAEQLNQGVPLAPPVIQQQRMQKAATQNQNGQNGPDAQSGRRGQRNRHPQQE